MQRAVLSKQSKNIHIKIMMLLCLAKFWGIKLIRSSGILRVNSKWGYINYWNWELELNILIKLLFNFNNYTKIKSIQGYLTMKFRKLSIICITKLMHRDFWINWKLIIIPIEGKNRVTVGDIKMKIILKIIKRFNLELFYKRFWISNLNIMKDT